MMISKAPAGRRVSERATRTTTPRNKKLLRGPVLIAGLGNPGSAYEATRHNIGRDIVTRFAKKIGAEDFAEEKKLRALVSTAHIGGTTAILALPETFMNSSGAAVSALAKKYRVPTSRVLVVHDDADILFGRAKLSFGRRSAGHNGVQSVIRALKTDQFWRFRIGIGTPRDLPAETIVLKKFSPAETQTLKHIIAATVTALETAATDGPDIAMNTYNQLS